MVPSAKVPVIEVADRTVHDRGLRQKLWRKLVVLPGELKTRSILDPEATVMVVPFTRPAALRVLAVDFQAMALVAAKVRELLKVVRPGASVPLIVEAAPKVPFPENVAPLETVSAPTLARLPVTASVPPLTVVFPV